ncbi:hypothetical protein D3C87_1122980 [compost metagenome]
MILLAYVRSTLNNETKSNSMNNTSYDGMNNNHTDVYDIIFSVFLPYLVGQINFYKVKIYVIFDKKFLQIA